MAVVAVVATMVLGSRDHGLVLALVLVRLMVVRSKSSRSPIRPFVRRRWGNVNKSFSSAEVEEEREDLEFGLALVSLPPSSSIHRPTPPSLALLHTCTLPTYRRSNDCPFYSQVPAFLYLLYIPPLTPST